MRTLCAFAGAVALLSGCARPTATATATTWSPRAAQTYLDRRANWWAHWPEARRDHGTFCISCHTTLPYALARPAIAERASPVSAHEQTILDNVRTRVRHWADESPYYDSRTPGSAKPVQSRGTESVINALILADADARTGRLSDDTRRAFEDMWTTQLTTGDQAGAWPWLQFGLDPWEGDNGQYYGAALAALAVGRAPDAYASSAAVQPVVGRLRAYLDRAFAAQPLSNRAVLLWASGSLPGVIGRDRAQGIAADLRRAQHDDGGWSLASLSARRAWWDPRRFRSPSDGYATGLAVLALAAVSDGDDAHLARGLTWLATHQNPADGSWHSDSLNGLNPDSPDVVRFMDDAATAYAVLALADASPQVR